MNVPVRRESTRQKNSSTSHPDVKATFEVPEESPVSALLHVAALFYSQPEKKKKIFATFESTKCFCIL